MSISFKGSGGGGKGGYDPSGVTATPADVLQGKSFMAKDGSMQAGTIPLKNAEIVKLDTGKDQTIDAGQYLAGPITIPQVKLQSKTGNAAVSVSAGSSATFYPDSGYLGLSAIKVSSPAVTPSVNFTESVFELDNRVQNLTFDCKVNNPRLWGMIAEGAGGSETRKYLAAIYAWVNSGGTDYVYACFIEDMQIIYQGDIWTHASYNGSQITIDLSEIGDGNYYFDSGATYHVWASAL